MWRPSRLFIALAALGLLACTERPPLGDCKDSLTGTWRASVGERERDGAYAPSGELRAFHILDRGAEVTVYPMFDDSHPPAALARGDAGVWWTPGMFQFKRIAGALVGERRARATLGPKTCAIVGQAAIRSCRADALELSWTDIVRIDLPACTMVSASRFTRVRLTREWP